MVSIYYLLIPKAFSSFSLLYYFLTIYSRYIGPSRGVFLYVVEPWASDLELVKESRGSPISDSLLEA